MLVNLKTEILKKGITAVKISKKLGISEKAMSNKITEKSDFTRSEMFAINHVFFPNLNMEYLFQSDKD